MRSNRVFIVLGVILFCLTIVGSARGEMKSGAFSVTPFFGGYVFEGNQDLKDGLTYGLGLGYNLGEHWGAEAVFNYVDTEFEEGSGDVDGYLYRLDCLYHFKAFQRLVPYLAAGIGGITLDPDRNDDDTDFLVNYGAGLKYFLTETVALRGDVRHIISFDETQNNLAYTLGLTFLFGGEKREAPPTPKDSDGDGVYDNLDKCPDTPAGVSVDSFGCPLDSDGDGVPDYLDQCPNTPSGVKVDAKGCPLDSDGDGVPDYLDQCPNTPRTVKVDEKGCPIDSDRDGVPDYMDQCPNTPDGVKVDTKGCPADSDEDGVPDYLDQCPRTPKGATVNEVGCWVCKGVEFDFNKWNIKPEYYPNLDEAVDCMRQHSYIKVEIQGHTDNVGTKEYNQILSESRAKAVTRYFIGKGIAKERLTAVGYGLSKPIASNETKEGRAKNRRVQLKPIY